MKKYYLYTSRTSIQFSLWLFDLNFGLWVTWSSGLFLLVSVSKRMTKEEYVKVRDEQTDE